MRRARLYCRRAVFYRVVTGAVPHAYAAYCACMHPPPPPYVAVTFHSMAMPTPGLQVLVSIQSLILVPQPYYNEPGYERTMGTPEGDRENAKYNSEVRTNCIKCAMLDHFTHQDEAFDDVIKVGFPGLCPCVHACACVLLRSVSAVGSPLGVGVGIGTCCSLAQ